MIIDAHVHVDSVEEVSLLLSSMRTNKIDKACVFYSPFSISSDPLKQVWSLDSMSAELKNYNNLYPIGAMKITDNPQFDRDVCEIETLLKEKKIHGIKFYLGYEHFYANDPKINPLCRLCIKHDVPALFHTGDCWISEGTKNALLRYANPMYIDDLAVKFPELKIIICHLGNPWVEETALLIAKNPNVYGDISGLLSYDSKHKELDNQIVKKKIIELIAWCHSGKKLIFGTDYPIYNHKEYLDFVNSFSILSKEEKEFVMHKNATTLFRL